MDNLDVTIVQATLEENLREKPEIHGIVCAVMRQVDGKLSFTCQEAEIGVAIFCFNKDGINIDACGDISGQGLIHAVATVLDAHSNECKGGSASSVH